MNTRTEMTTIRLCDSGKMAYVTEADAWARLVEIRNQCRHDKLTRAHPRRIYLCKRCGFWHLTSQRREGR